MAGKLLQEIHKTKPFDSLQQEVFLNVIRTADHFMRAFEDLLKPYTLSATQYNVLRILRGHCCEETVLKGEAGNPIATGGGGSGGGGIPCKAIGEHMITRDPDITRLLDRLEARSMIARQRDTRDRRVVSTRITAEGLRVLKELDKPVQDFHRIKLAHVPENKLAQLIDLLELMREGP
jgi:DNA-binding MarR family transcriptional regulator